MCAEKKKSKQTQNQRPGEMNSKQHKRKTQRQPGFHRIRRESRYVSGLPPEMLVRENTAFDMSFGQLQIREFPAGADGKQRYHSRLPEVPLKERRSSLWLCTVLGN